MKISKSFLLLFALAAAFSSLAPVPARADVSFEFFSENLDPYGEWIETSNYGYCWRPSGVDEDWAPYTDGYWAYTDGGWTWVSYEDFGGITYHYGRWTRLSGVGWCWVPGYEWAPAWVSWRSGNDYIGWAPLPPECRFNRGIGISFWVDTTYAIGPGNYNFCSYRDFGSPALRPVIVNRGRNVAIINNTTNITNITVNNTRNIIYNGGPVFATVASRTARPIQTLKLSQETDVNAIRASGRKTLARQQGNQLIVAAPLIAPPSGKVRPQRVARTLENVEVDNGWNKVKDPHVRQQLEAKMKRDVKGFMPEQAPAKAVTASELNVVAEQTNKAPPQALTRAGQGGVRDGKRAGDKQPASTVITGQPAVAPVETPVAATPEANQKDLKGRKGKSEILQQAPVQPVAATGEQAITAGPTHSLQGDTKNKEVKSGGQPMRGPAQAIPENVTSGQANEKKPASVHEVAQPPSAVDLQSLEKQQQIQAGKASQQKVEQQQTAREREAQIQQQGVVPQPAPKVDQREVEKQQQAEQLNQRKLEQQQAVREREAQVQQQRAAAMQQREAQAQQQQQAGQLNQRKLEQQQAAREREAQVQQQRAAAMQQREAQHQQQQQAEKSNQRNIEQQQAARERQAQMQQQRAAVMQQKQVQQANPQAVQQAPEKGKGKKHDQKEEEQPR